VGDFAAGTPEERREDIIKMIDDPEVKVIWAAEGGYAATEVLPVFTKEIIQKLRQNPKWFIGYSDVCVLLNALVSFRIASIQGPNFSGIAEKDEKSQIWLRRMLFGEMGLEIGSDGNWTSYISGQAEGTLLVSNLESLIVTLGTRYDPLMHGSGDIILGLEDWWIEKSTLQRQIDMILNHKRASRIKGIIVGRFVGIGEYSYPVWGKKVTPEALIEGRIRLRGAIMPMAVLSDFGHHLEPTWLEERFPNLQKPHRFLALPNGIKVKYTVDSSSGRLQFLESITS
jgi:muramoyltetrapeptide carboxypeptidase